MITEWYIPQYDMYRYSLPNVDFTKTFIEPNQNTRIYYLGQFDTCDYLLSYGVTAKRMGVSVSAIQNRIKRNAIQRVSVNGRFFIPAHVPEFGKGRKTKPHIMGTMIQPFHKGKKQDWYFFAWETKAIGSYIRLNEKCETQRVYLMQEKYKKGDRHTEYIVKDGYILEAIPINKEDLEKLDNLVRQDIVTINEDNSRLLRGSIDTFNHKNMADCVVVSEKKWNA